MLLYAHGGLVSEEAAVQRLAEYRTPLLEAEVYPVSFIWHSDAWSTFTNILKDAIRKKKPEGFIDASKDFMLDRLDNALEPLARVLTGRILWKEMQENALDASRKTEGGARIALECIASLAKQLDKSFEIHIIGHSAGAIFMAPLIQQLVGMKGTSYKGINAFEQTPLPIESCTLWAPACTMELFKGTYLPAIKSGAIRRFATFALTDTAEQEDHCARIYNKSLLYLVSNAFEDKPRIPLFREGTALLGMHKFIDKDPEIRKLFASTKADLVLAPNNNESDPRFYSTCKNHGGFDDDQATVLATLARILNQPDHKSQIQFNHSASSLQNRRRHLL